MAASPCFNKWLAESFISNNSFQTADSIETKQVIIICYIYIELFWVLKRFTWNENHHQCAASTWMIRRQPEYYIILCYYIPNKLTLFLMESLMLIKAIFIWSKYRKIKPVISWTLRLFLISIGFLFWNVFL